MKTVKEILIDLNSSLNWITFYLFVIILQGCFGCNRCKHEEKKPDKVKTEINWSEEWKEFKYK